jgi:hypothetical protein
MKGYETGGVEKNYDDGGRHQSGKIDKSGGEIHELE